MFISHKQEAPTGASLAEPLRPQVVADILSGKLVGVTLRTAQHPEGVEVAVLPEVALHIGSLLVDAALAHLPAFDAALDELRARHLSRRALYLSTCQTNPAQ
ncbi:hypothetical protein [Hymenobacter guriensis]|uniref:Uncharacterized protein n=1 Tax=Hymenobacter guriensis TaxID=2793065 RepID=A0ABS0L7P9_9BACT|nr:hypothetical protein [Hymenobacter guriensis]MBG8556151.1 hypothetical protein [Hymenobacter guriensis]